MLIRATPEQVSQLWGFIRGEFAKGLSPDLARDEEAYTNMLRSILAEEAWVWFEMDERYAPRAVLLTTTNVDNVIGVRDFVIYIFTAFGGPIDRESYIDGIETLREFARQLKCRSLITHILDERFARFLAGLGYKATATLISIAV